MAGNNIKPILTSVEDAPRPETQYSKHKRTQDPSLRWRQGNVLHLDLETVGKMSQSYNGPLSKSRVNQIVKIDIDKVDEQIKFVENSDVPGNPYKRYSDVSSLF